MPYEWDPAKAEHNLVKHGVSFDEARTVFRDPLVVSLYDREHSTEEDRWLAVGHSSNRRLLVVWYTERGEAIRIIGCRTVTWAEYNRYVNRTED